MATDLYQIPEEHLELREAVRALCEKEIAPHAADVDEQGRYPTESRAALTASGFHAIHRSSSLSLTPVTGYSNGLVRLSIR